LDEKIVVAGCVCSIILLIVCPCIPTVQSMEREKQIKRVLENQKQELINLNQNELKDFDIDKDILRKILARIIKPLSFLISIPGLLIRGITIMFLKIIFFIQFDFMRNFPKLEPISKIFLILPTIKLFKFLYLGILLTYPLIITNAIISSNGQYSFLETIQWFIEFFKEEIISCIKFYNGLRIDVFLFFIIMTMYHFIEEPLSIIIDDYQTHYPFRNLFQRYADRIDLFMYWPVAMISGTLEILLSYTYVALEITFREAFYFLFIEFPRIFISYLINVFIPWLIDLIEDYFNPSNNNTLNFYSSKLHC